MELSAGSQQAPRPVASAARLLVGCAISDRAAFSRVTSAVAREGGISVPLGRGELLNAAKDFGIGALVYDLEPGDASAVKSVLFLRDARPDWPVWIYYSARMAIAERITQVASLWGLWATPQAMDAQSDNQAWVHVRHLLASVPRVRLLRLLDSILRPLPIEVRTFLELALGRGGHADSDRFRVQNGATDPARLRHLQRMCRASTGLGPKRLLDHLILVLVAFTAFAYGLPLRQAARQCQISPVGLDRLIHRVLGRHASVAVLDAHAQFEYALVAVAKVCDVPAIAAAAVVQAVIRERPA